MIAVPVLLELAIHESSSYGDQLLNIPLGDQPIVFNLTKLELKDTEIFMKDLSVVLQERNIHPFFPYPFYLLHDTLPLNNNYLIARDLKTIATHYLRKMEYPKSKDLAVLNKVNMVVQKIRNLPINDFMNKLSIFSSKQQEIIALCDKTAFLSKIGEIYEK